MALLSSVFDFVFSRPWLVVLGFAIYCLVFAISVLFSKPKAGKNPFLGDCRRPPRPLVHDKAERDRVLKQGLSPSNDRWIDAVLFLPVLIFNVSPGFTQKRIPENVDVIVIGSGIAGLTTAALLSKAGKKVLVLEQHDQAGGCCHTFVEKGFEFDVGMCYLLH